MFFYILYKIGYIISNILPLRVAYCLAERFSDIHYYISKKDREVVAQNLNVVLKKDIAETRVLAQKVFRNFGLYLVDFFRMVRLDKEIVEKKVRVIGLENLDKALRQNKGVIALSCHIGNWEMGGVIIGLMGYDISAVVLTHTHKAINEFFIRQREKRGLKVISMNSVAKCCISVLSRNGILALAADRDFTNSGIELDFFGVPTSIPKGPAALSLRFGSPIVPCFLIREDRFKYRLIFEEPIEIKERQGIEHKEIIREATRNLVSIMERHIISCPEQWLVFRRFWEVPENAFVL